MDLPSHRDAESEIESFLRNWESKKELAATLLRSGFLSPSFKTPEQVIAVMLKGQELGIPAMEALNSIHVVNGKPAVSPQLMLSLARRSKELDDVKIEHTGDSCIVTITRKGQSPHTSHFGDQEARSLGLHTRDNYRKQAHSMYQWRALAANLRVTFPDIIGGLYTPEEMGAEVIMTDDGAQLIIESDNPPHRKSDVLHDSGYQPDMFDPSKEVLTFGKYAGVFWSEVPENYLNWLKGNAAQPEVLAKVDETLRSRVASAIPKPDDAIMDEMFGATDMEESASDEKYRTLTTPQRESAAQRDAVKAQEGVKQKTPGKETSSDENRRKMREEYIESLVQEHNRLPKKPEGPPDTH